MAACSICKTNIPAADVIAGKYKKQDGQAICLKCDAVAVPRPAAARPAAVGAAKSAAPASGKPVAQTPGAKTPSGAGKGATRPPGQRPIRTQAHYQQPQGLDSATKIGAMIAGGVLLVGGVVFFLIFSKHSKDDAAKKAKLDASLAAVTSVEKVVASTPEDYDAILAKVEEARASKAVIEQSKDELQLNKIEQETRRKKTDYEFRKRNIDAYAQCEKDADNPEKAEETVKAIQALAEAARGMEEDFIKKVDALSLKIHTNAINFIEKEIKDFQAGNPKSLREILEKYRRGIQRMQEMQLQPGETGKLARGKAKDLKTAEEDFAVMYYNEVAERSAWSNLLDQNRVSSWFKSGPVEISFEGGQMIAKSTAAPGTKERGTILSGKKDFWIDFDIEFEVELKAFGFGIVGRYSGPQNFFQLPFETGGEGNPIVEGGIFKCFVSSVGREVIQRVEKWNPEANAWEKIDLATEKYSMPNAARAGAFGFGIMPGGTSVFRAIRARVIRADTN